MRTSNRRIADLFAPSGWARQCCQVEAALALAQAEIGISGVNLGVASTGTVCIVENEGNARMSTTFTKAHIVVAGIEKILELNSS